MIHEWINGYLVKITGICCTSSWTEDGVMTMPERYQPIFDAFLAVEKHRIDLSARNYYLTWHSKKTLAFQKTLQNFSPQLT